MAVARYNPLARALSSIARAIYTYKPRTSLESDRLPAELSDWLARDIGLDRTELELRRMKWPSETFRHPRL